MLSKTVTDNYDYIKESLENGIDSDTVNLVVNDLLDKSDTIGRTPKQVKKAIDELEKISLSPEERQRYEDREWAIMRYYSEVRANYEHGHKAGEEFGEKKRISKR